MPPETNHSPHSDYPHRYNADYAGKLELRWQGEWEKQQAFKVPNPGESGFDASRPKFFCMDMFPYPSGAGLHVGHPEGYTATDIICRYKRMKGFNVLHPMGWDAFGLPAEQYAIQTGVHPAITTRKAIDTFRRQLKRFGFCYDWSREFATIDEDYYRWTQWIFLQIYNAWYDEDQDKARPISELIDGLKNGTYAIGPSAELVRAGEGPGSLGVFDGMKAGLKRWHELSPREQRAFIDTQRLAYIDEQVVNWCPKLGTALANEEVIDGKSERGSFPVFRKPLRQWMFHITAFAERLLKDLNGLDWPHSTRTMQQEWIGKSEGAEIDFELDLGGTDLRDVFSSGFSTVPVLFDQEETVQLNPKNFVARDPYPAGSDSPTDLMRLVRNLPHLELPGATYFVTWRAADGMTLSESERDAVVDVLTHFDGERCRTYALCVMPDHVHWIVRPYDNESVVKLAASVKQFTATKLNKQRGRSGSLWQDESFDHIIRGKRWFAEFVKYVVRNPVEATIVRKPSEYRWTWLHADVLSGHVPEVRATQDSAVQEIQALRVFTTRPDTIFGATYMVVAPEHELIEQILGFSAGHVPEVRATQNSATKAALREYVTAAKNRSDVERQENKEKTGVFTGVYAINPATEKKIPVWTADYVLTGYGTGAIMAVPAQDERDWEFAKKFGLPIVRTVQPPVGFGDEPFTGEGVAINSDFLNGLSIAAAKQKIIAWLEEQGIGTRKINYKLRDWLFSRQRYWGEPFPIVFDSHGDAFGVNDAALPVTLPPMDDYHPEESDEPKPLLGKAKEWVKTTAGAAGVSADELPADAPVTRETNTMPGWAGSCWYYLRYCDPKNAARFCSEEAERYWMTGKAAKPHNGKAANENGDGAGGVDLYIGGSEHAVLHLLYARFWHKALFDLGHVSTKEPFQKLFHQGLITSFSYQRPDKTLVPTDQIEERGEGQFFEKATDAKLAQVTAKMSKSLKNVVNPDDVIAEFGADTFRLYEMYMGPLDASKPWNPRDITGCFRFLQRAWRLCVDEQSGMLRFADTSDDAIERLLHRTIAKVEGDIERLAFNTAIAALIQFVNEATAEKPTLTRSQVERFTLMLAPFAPHMAEEVWCKMGGIGFASHGVWPAYEEAMLKDSSVEMPVQIMGKIKARITVAADLDAKAVEAAALADSKVQEALAGKAVKRVIVVPGKMVNVVVA